MPDFKLLIFFQPLGIHNSQSVSVRHATALKDQNYEVVHLNRPYHSRHRQDGGSASKTDDRGAVDSCLPTSRGGAATGGVITLFPGSKSGVILRLDFPAGINEQLNCSLKVKAGKG